jgi:CheY-like chemotaxis protein
MDGLSLAAAIRAAGHAVPIVLLSSNPARAREGPGAAGLAAVLQKPILRSDLFRRLADIAAPPPPPAPEPQRPAPAEGRRMRVLVAEDNRTNQLVFRKMIADLDVDLTFAGNGREAVELWRSLRPDLIFMDISMPEMDGREAARAIRAEEALRGGRVPIVALSAHALDGDAEAALAAGIDRYVTKPLRRSTILAAITAAWSPEMRPIGHHSE